MLSKRRVSFLARDLAAGPGAATDRPTNDNNGQGAIPPLPAYFHVDTNSGKVARQAAIYVNFHVKGRHEPNTHMTLQATVQYLLKALTTEATSALRSDAYLCTELPLRVGRDTRTLNGLVPREIAERRTPGMEPNNDLYLREAGHEVYVSREHFLIDYVGGEYRLVDRLSALGTWVEGRLIGGDRRGGDCRLLPGDIIMPGSYKSGFIFKFLVGEN